MWDILLNLGGLIVLAVLIMGAALSYFLLHGFIGAEASAVLGLLFAAYPAFLAFRNFGP